jgi:2-polyprenyl-3-methyl-5-hydroxy-6-metoxy-1,4-benzoquinol methylase
MLSEIAFRAVGVDISQDAINYARHVYGGAKMKYLCSDLFELDPATCLFDFGPFDCVVSFETLEHVTNGRGFVRIMSSILKPCGVFVVSTPNNWGVTKYHKVNYTLDSFIDVLQSEFDIIEMFNQNSGGTHIFNHKQGAGIVPTTEANKGLAECYIAICRKRI